MHPGSTGADGSRLVLVIDDEPQIHRFLRPALEAAGYAVATAASATEGLRLAVQHPPDMVLLDLGLPDMDGKQALARLRAFSAVPVIVLSARDRETEKIAALDGGADDYVEKPFSLGELLARIRTALRRRDGQAPPAGDGILEAGPVSLDIPAHRLLVAGEPVMLSPREFQLLAMLMRHAGRLVTHRQLLTTVWGPAHADDVQYLRVYIGHLRQKLGADAAPMITTEPGIGYRLVAGPA